MLYYNTKIRKKALMISATRRLDGIAIALSGACLVHCLLLPIAAAFMPLLVPAADAEWVHWVFVALAVPVSVLALRHRHSSARLTLGLRMLAVLGLGLLALGATGWPQPRFETAITVFGGLVLASVHATNFFACRRAPFCDAHPSSDGPLRVTNP
jgi:hypothetical protein